MSREEQSRKCMLHIWRALRHAEQTMLKRGEWACMKERFLNIGI